MCPKREILREPEWFGKIYPPGFYKGISVLCEDKKEAREDAILNALQEFGSKEFGIRIKSKSFWKKSEVGENVYYKYESYAFKETYPFVVKNYQIRKEKIMREKGKYRAYVLIYIPDEEVSRIRKDMEEYKKMVLEHAGREFKKADSLFEMGNYPMARARYETIENLLKNLNPFDPQVKSMLDRVKGKISLIKKIAPPEVVLMELKPGYTYISNIRIIDAETGREVKKEGDIYYVDAGEWIRFEFDVLEEVYIYVLSLWKEEGELRLLFPNRYVEEKKGKIRGKVAVPSDTIAVRAEPPGGMNYVFFIATTFPLNIDYKNEILPDEFPSEFVETVKRKAGIYYDIRMLKVYIRE